MDLAELALLITVIAGVLAILGYLSGVFRWVWGRLNPKPDVPPAPLATEQFDVFLSYSHVDAHLVEELARRLEDDQKLTVWLDRWVLVAGESWQQAMAKGLNEAKSCAVCIGEDTPDGWFGQEVEKALNRQASDPDFRVIPVLLPNARQDNLGDFLELRTWVDFREGLGDERQFHVLVSGIRGVPSGRGPRPSPPVPEVVQVEARRKLIELREFRTDQLVDDSVAVEYQRKLLDRWLEDSGNDA